MADGIAFSIGSLDIMWYGVLIALAFAVGGYLALREVKRQHLDTDHLMNMLLIILPAAIIGARLYYVAMSWDYYSQHPEMIIRTWEGGMAIHGGIIASMIGIIIYCKIKKLAIYPWFDLMAPFLALGQAIGRWGNFINQEAYGAPTDLPWAIMIDGVGHHPTFLYESIWNVLVFISLKWMLSRPHRIGSVFAGYLIFYSIGRFFIEMLRTDSLMLGPFRVAMLVSGLGVLVGIIILQRIAKNPPVDVAKPPQKKAAPNKKSTKKTR